MTRIYQNFLVLKRSHFRDTVGQCGDLNVISPDSEVLTAWTSMADVLVLVGTRIRTRRVTKQLEVRQAGLPTAKGAECGLGLQPRRGGN